MTIDQDHLAPRNPIIYIGTTEQTELEVRCIVILHIGIDRQRSGQENETGSVQLVITRQSVLSFKTLITTASDDLVFFCLFFFVFFLFFFCFVFLFFYFSKQIRLGVSCQSSA